MAARNEEALARDLQELPGWQRHGDGIWKTYEFDDFASAALFVGRVADATARPAISPTSPSAAAGSPWSSPHGPVRR